MKVVLIILGIIGVLFLVIQVFASRNQSDIETYAYDILKSYDDFEIRKYDSRLFNSVKLNTGEYKKGSSQGFSILAGYIFGGNSRNEKIAMTSPVAMTMEDSMEVMFMVPEQYDEESLPTPNQSAVKTVRMPEQVMAAIRFGGWANDDKIKQYKELLVQKLQQEGIKHTDRFYFFGYNPPYEVFNRRNEVLIVLDEKMEGI